MKILHVVEAYGGGVFNSVTQLSNLFADKQNEVVLVYSLRAETPSDYKNYIRSSIKLIPLSMCRSVSPFKDCVSLIKLLMIIKNEKPNVIHLHSSKAGFLGRLASFLLGDSGCVVYSPRGLAYEQVSSSASVRLVFLYLEKIAAIFGGLTVGCSKSEAQSVIDNVSSKNVTYIENAIDMDILPKKKQSAFDEVVVVSSGRFCFQKDPGSFLALAKKFSDKPVKFIWVGGGDVEWSFKFEEVGIHVTGWISRIDTLDWISQADVYVQASLWEGMPLAVIEAQSIGIPALVTDVIGNRDVVIHGETGFIAKNESALHNYLEQLIEDSNLRDRLSCSAFMNSSYRFSLERLFNDYNSIYLQLDSGNK